MSKVQILTALLLSYLAFSCAEEKPAQKRIDDNLRPPPILIKQAPKEESSYFSKIADWFRSFGEADKKRTVIHALPPAPLIIPPSGPPSYHGPQTFGPPHVPNIPPSLGPAISHGPPSGPPVIHPPSPGPIYHPPTHRPSHGPPKIHSQPPPSYSPPIRNPQPATTKLNIIQPQHNHISGPGIQSQATSNSNRYLPPHPSSDDKDCNPCNKEPWVPIVSNYGSNTLIGFVPNTNSNHKDRPSVYGPPNRPPKEYGVPSAPNNQYGVPPTPTNQYGPPNNQYGAPPQPSAPSTNYGAPIAAPSNNYGPPQIPQGNYGPPQKPSSQYGPPNHGIEEIAPPKLPSRPPSNTYGPPGIGELSIKYGPPKKPSFLPTPTPLIPNKYGPPVLTHRRPRPHSLRPPIPSAFMGPPPTSSIYGPPATNFGAHNSLDYSPKPSAGPVNSYGPPPSGPANVPPAKPPSNYGPPLTAPSTIYGVPKAPPPTNSYVPPSGPSQQTYGAPQGNSYLPPFPTPTASGVSNNYNVPPQQFVTPVSNKPVQDSYGPPAAGPIHNENVKLTSDEYLPPPHELPISNGDESGNFESLHVPPQPDYNNGVDPIPFPNMSPSFILPIRNALPFRPQNPSGLDNLSSQGSNIPIPTGGAIINHGQSNVQISQSVPVADFLSTIEYPPNVVQSPLIDLVVNDNLGNADNEHQQQNQNNDYRNLKDNPIVVDGDEHHQEASDNHASVAVHDTAISTKLKFTPSILNTIEHTKPTASAINSKDIKNSDNVQIDPSLQTLLHDENLAEIIAKQLLSENNNPPKPFEPSENSAQKSEAQVNQNAQATNNALFTQPTIDYSNWNPSVAGLSTGMQPPAPSQPSWISTNNYVPFTTKKPKQIQIIVPYTTNNKGSNWHKMDSRKVPPPGSTSPPYNPPIALFGKLPSAEDSQWSKYIDHNFQESKTNIAQTPSPISNIQDFFKDATVNIDASHSQNLPFDILKLQKNIDVWTEQEFNKMRFDVQSSTTSRFAYSKKIPDEYLTTQSINLVNEVTTSSPNNRNSKLFNPHDYLASGSVHHSVESRPHNLTELAIDSNLVEGSSEKPKSKEAWDKIQVTISPLTNERVYVVTPLPWETGATTPQSAWTYVPKKEISQINKQLADNANFVFNSPRFAVRPEPLQMNKSDEDVHNKIHLVYSDWPELINGLATASTEQPPLLGRMDISQHTPPPGQGVQTYTGHSKVVTAVTASSVTKKRTGIEDKKFTASTKTPDKA